MALFAHLTSRDLMLKGKIGEKIVAEMMLKQRREYPFKVLNVTARSGKDIAYQLEEMIGTKPGVYSLKVTNKRKSRGRYFDTIYIHTDNSLHPQININVTGVILAPQKS